MDAIYSRPWSRHNNTRGRRDARLKNMCIKVGFSDDSKGTFVCFFWSDVSWILGKTPGIYFLFSQVFCICNSGGCGVFSFAFFIFLALSNYILNMFQWCHIDSECRFISNNLNRIHSHLKWPIMSNDSECATSQISGLSDPFGARSMWFTRSCRVAWNAAVKTLSWGSFTPASPLKWWISWGKSGRTSMKERVKSWGKGDEKHGKP